MTPAELVHAAEGSLRGAQDNVESSVASLNEHKRRGGGVPTSEVLALAQAQAAVAHAYASIAMAKAAIEPVAP